MQLKFYDEMDNNGIVDLGGWEHSIDVDIDRDNIVNLKTLKGYGNYSCENVKTENDLIELLKNAESQIQEIITKGDKVTNCYGNEYFELDEYVYNDDCTSIEVIEEIIEMLQEQTIKAVA